MRLAFRVWHGFAFDLGDPPEYYGTAMSDLNLLLKWMLTGSMAVGF